MSCVNVVLFCNLIGTTRARCRKSTTFPTDFTRLSPPPFLRKEPGNKTICNVPSEQSTVPHNYALPHISEIPVYWRPLKWGHSLLRTL